MAGAQLTLSTFIPLKAPSTPNLREHWATKSKRAAAQRGKARLLTPRWTGGPLLRVTLTRVGVRELDSDNLASACKAVRDGVADRLRLDDGSPLVEWAYRQEKCLKGAEGVRVEIEALKP